MRRSGSIRPSWGLRLSSGRLLLEAHTSPFYKFPTATNSLELTSFPPSGPVKVQEDLVHLAFQVENLDETIASLKEQGITITDGPTKTSSGSRFIFIDAPDGYEIELIERPAGTTLV